VDGRLPGVLKRSFRRENTEPKVGLSSAQLI